MIWRKCEPYVPLITMSVAVAIAVGFGPRISNYVERVPGAGTAITSSAELTVGTRVDDFSPKNILPNGGRSAAVVGTVVKLETFVIANMSFPNGRGGINDKKTALLKKNKDPGDGVPKGSNVCDLKTSWQLCALVTSPSKVQRAPFNILSVPVVITSTADNAFSFKTAQFGATGGTSTQYGYTWSFRTFTPTGAFLSNIPPPPPLFAPIGVPVALGAKAEGIYNVTNSPVETTISVSRNGIKPCRDLFNP